MKNLKAILACLIFVAGQFLPLVAVAHDHSCEEAAHCTHFNPAAGASNFNSQCMRGMSPGCAGGPPRCFSEHPHFQPPQTPNPINQAPTQTQTVSAPPPVPHTPVNTQTNSFTPPNLVDQCRAMQPHQFWHHHHEHHEFHEFAHPHPLPSNVNTVNQTAGVRPSINYANCAQHMHDAHEAYCSYISNLNSGNLTRAFPHMHEHAFIRANNNGVQGMSFRHHEMHEVDHPNIASFRGAQFAHYDNHEIPNNLNTQIASVPIHHHEHLENGAPCQWGRNGWSSTISRNNALNLAGSTTANGSMLGTTNISNTFGLDLNSTVPVIPADIAHSMTILVGGTLNASGNIVGARHEMTIDPGQLLTPAQYAALQQVAGSGQQTLVVNFRGAATGGLLTLAANQTADTLSSAFIPRGVGA